METNIHKKLGIRSLFADFVAIDRRVVLVLVAVLLALEWVRLVGLADMEVGGTASVIFGCRKMERCNEAACMAEGCRMDLLALRLVGTRRSGMGRDLERVAFGVCLRILVRLLLVGGKLRGVCGWIRIWILVVLEWRIRWRWWLPQKEKSSNTPLFSNNPFDQKLSLSSA